MKMTRGITAVLAAGGCTALIGLGVQGLTPGAAADAGEQLYVSQTTGSDSADGSEAHPWATIGHATGVLSGMTVGQGGITVHVLAGTYREAVVNDKDGRADGYVTFAADDPGKVLIKPSSGKFAFRNNGDYVRISGFDVTGPTASEGIYLDASHDVVQGNHVHGVATIGCQSDSDHSEPGYTGTGDGIGDNGDESDNVIIGNKVEGNGPSSRCDYKHGIYPSAARDLVQNNITYGNSGSGIRFNHNTVGITIANNLTFHNRNHGIHISGNDDSDKVASGFVITNNIIARNAMFGVNVNSNADDPGNEYGHNLFFQNGYGVFGKDNTKRTPPWTPGKTDGEITDPADLGLVDYRDDGTGDYHLKPSSPAVNAGTKLGAPDTDYEGVRRPQGDGYDMGPFELAASTTPPTTPPTSPPPSGGVTVGFEDGSAQGWSGLYGGADPVVTTDTAYEGTHALRFGLSSSGHSAVGTSSGLGAVGPGVTVTFQVWAYQDGTTVRPFVRDKQYVPSMGADVRLAARQWTTVSWQVPSVASVGAIGLDASPGSGAVAIDALTWPTS